MRTETSVIDLPDVDDAFVSDSDLIGFWKPSEIVHDPILTLARKSAGVLLPVAASPTTKSGNPS